MGSEDTLREILYRLPFEDLTRFKTVSKECYTLISDPGFDHDKHRVVGDNAIVSTYTYPYGSFEVYGLRCNGSDKDELISPLEFDYPCYEAKTSMVLGSYNGLVAIKFDYLGYMLWNPVTLEQVSFNGPALVMDPTAVGLCCYNNGFRDEYLVVVVGDVRHRFGMIPCVELVNFGTNESKSVSWSSHQELLYGVNGVGTVVNGVPHWVKEFDDVENLWARTKVVYFDPSNETFNEFVLPGHINWSDEKPNKRVLGLGALNGQSELGLVLQDTSDFDSPYDVWVMKEYGKQETWTRLCKIPSLKIENFYEYVNLVGIKSGEVWVHHVKSPAETEELKLITYDPINQRVKNVHVSGGEDMVVRVTSYEPSSVSPSSNYVDEEVVYY